ncbi:RIPP2 protein, partial [Alcedo cyanopectus]|nr:RIPP2 protein [Ceyx cyanopectus]
RRRMEGGALGCGCPRPLALVLAPQGRSLRCGCGCGSGSLPSARSSAPFWRPWVPAEGQVRRRSCAATIAPLSPCGLPEGSRKLAQYRHPVRLFWPKSRCYDYLYQEAEALLKNFPVQATISFYEDSDSEDEDELEQDARTESDC